VEWRLAGETEVLGENLPQATLSTTNPTWPDPGSNPGRRGGKPAINRLSYGVAFGFTCSSTTKSETTCFCERWRYLRTTRRHDPEDRILSYEIILAGLMRTHFRLKLKRICSDFFYVWGKLYLLTRSSRYWNLFNTLVNLSLHHSGLLITERLTVLYNWNRISQTALEVLLARAVP
jgi:hypothetical protein